MLDPESRMAAIPGSRKIPAVQQSTPLLPFSGLPNRLETGLNEV